MVISYRSTTERPYLLHWGVAIFTNRFIISTTYIMSEGYSQLHLWIYLMKINFLPNFRIVEKIQKTTNGRSWFLFRINKKLKKKNLPGILVVMNFFIQGLVLCGVNMLIESQWSGSYPETFSYSTGSMCMSRKPKHC